MDIGFKLGTRENEAFRGRPEWHGLRARLFAARAARLALEAAARPGLPVGDGSFDRGSARLMAGYRRGLGGVNPTGLSNRKSNRVMDVADAEVSRTGDRG